MIYLKLLGFILLIGVAVLFIILLNLLDIVLYLSLPVLTFLYARYLHRQRNNKKIT